MKNRLMFLALAMICYGHMQGISLLTNYRNWPQIKKDIRNFDPYSSISSLKQSPSYAAQRIAAIERLYETTDDNRWYPGQLRALQDAYDTALYNERNKSFEKVRPLWAKQEIASNKIKNLENAKWYYDTLPLLGQYFWNRTENASKLNNLLNKQKNLEAKVTNFYNIMHPLSDARKEFEAKLEEERTKSGPLYEYFQNPSRNILSEY